MLLHRADPPGTDGILAWTTVPFLVVMAGFLAAAGCSLWWAVRTGWAAFQLRRRGVWVHGVIERHEANGVPYGIYRYTDPDGRVRCANMAGGRLPRGPLTETEIRIDPLGVLSPHHRSSTPAFSAAVLAVVGLTVLALAAVLMWFVVLPAGVSGMD